MDYPHVKIGLSLVSTVLVSCTTFSGARRIVSFLTLLASGVLISVLGVHSLSFVATETSHNASSAKSSSKNALSGNYISTSPVWTTRIVGIVAGIYFLVLPYFIPGGIIGECFGRAFFFACACKILDLTVARAQNPPKLIKNHKTVQTSDENRWRYIRLLLRECRYHSFDIAAVEKRNGPASTVWTFGPAIVMPLLAYFIPCSETRFLLVLLVIHAGMEGSHAILHPSSSHRLFWQPFAAGSISAFWRTHWQQDAASFLYSLAYAPARNVVARRFGKRAGRAAGVMAAFNLSGIWHGWAAASGTTTPWRTGVGMWALFVAHGALCLIEDVIWKDRQGGLLQRVLVWTFAIWSTGIWIRDTEQHLDVPWLREYLV